MINILSSACLEEWKKQHGVCGIICYVIRGFHKIKFLTIASLYRDQIVSQQSTSNLPAHQLFLLGNCSSSNYQLCVQLLVSSYLQLNFKSQCSASLSRVYSSIDEKIYSENKVQKLINRLSNTSKCERTRGISK